MTKLTRYTIEVERPVTERVHITITASADATASELRRMAREAVRQGDDPWEDAAWIPSDRLNVTEIRDQEGRRHA
jgi:hypothetical protein